ncbi:MAG: TIGR02186 family protein [Magnetovibrio sp.]|nr:TIGR02186 family protein [Magnetovibrio sp.]
MLRLILIIISVIFYTSTTAYADDLDVDLSRPDVRLDVSFKGSELLLFGAKDVYGDVIVVVRGPTIDTSVRLKQQIMGIWVKTDEVIFKDAPSYYAVATTQPIEDLLPAETLKTERIGTDNLELETLAKPDKVTPQALQDFTDGLIRNMDVQSLYTSDPGKVKLVGKQLFRTDLWFPSNVSVGDYTVDTYLVLDRQIQSKKTTHLQVHKVGFEARVYNFAHEHALIYGFLAVIIAVFSGWAANAIFMKVVTNYD